MKYIDLFAGVGGFHYGIDRACAEASGLEAGEKTTKILSGHLSDLQSKYGGHRTLTCVYSNEWDKYANSVYRRHYGECDNRDIRNVEASEIPDFDLLCGGFPCQSFSIAGKRGGFEDTRGTLFFEIARIVKEKRPRLLLLENVKGLLNHDQGRTFGTILSTLDELGYDAQWQVLNSKNFGVPQNRERVYIVGHLRGTPRPEVFPITEVSRLHPIEVTKEVSDAQRIYNPSGIAKTLKGLGGGLGAKTGLYAIPVLTPDRLEKRQNGRRFKEDGDPSFTLTSQDKHGIYDGVKIRRLTPTECERLQGFPDGWTALGHQEVLMSDSQRYKMMGNAVTTNVVTAIMEKLL